MPDTESLSQALVAFGLTAEEAEQVGAKARGFKAKGRSTQDAISMSLSLVAPSKARPDAPVAASFEAEPGTANIKIKGANYTFHDDGDGYFSCSDFPLFSEAKKGVKNAPKDVGQKELEDLVKNAQEQYHESDNPRCAPAFIRHNPAVEGFGADPIHSGFVLPRRVGPYRFHDGEKMAAFGALKIDKATLGKMQQGKLIAHSPEFNWAKWRITGMAFLPTRPPHFEFANNTVKEVLSDPSAKFEATLSDEDRVRFNEGDDDMALKEEVAKFQEEVKAEQEKTGKALGEIKDSLKALTSQSGKPDALPAEPGQDKTGKKAGGGGADDTAKMSMDPEHAAQFAAMVNDTAEIKQKLTAIETKEQSKIFMEKAENALSRKVVTEDCMKIVAQFAADAVDKKDGEKWFDATVAALKTSLRDKPPRNQGEFLAGGEASVADPQDPAVAKFQQEGPEVMEQVGKFAGQYRTLKAGLGDRFESTEEQFITNELMLWKARKNGSLQETRR